MARKEQTRGACSFCGRMMTRSGMARHLPTCESRQHAIAAAAGTRGSSSGIWIHLQLHDAAGGDHWLHLEMDATATLSKLDGYLRGIWLECCGHLSQFSVGGWGGRTTAKSARAGQVLRPGVELTHIYDFGTESVTVVRVLDVRNGPGLTRKPIALMARNEAPSVSCMECGEPATELCMQCVIEFEAEGTLCEKHAEAHPHDDYGEPVPIVNSPRVGMCGYTGPADPPY